MNQPGQKKYLFDNPRNISLVVLGLYLVCILLVLLDFIIHRHVTNEWEGFTGFYALFGFTAYVTIVFTANLLRKILQRREDYYDVDE